MMTKKQQTEQTSLTDQVVEGSFWGGFSDFLNRIGAFILTIILARVLFPDGFGLYTLTMSIALIFMTFADLGLDQAMIRYFSSTKNKNKSASYFQYTFKIKLLLSFLVSFLLLISAYPLSYYIFKKPELFLPLIISAVFILTSLILYFLSSIFYAVKKVKYLGIREIAFQIIRLAIIFIVFLLLSYKYYVIGVLVGLILTNLIIILLLLLWINKLTPFIFKKTEEKIDKIKVIKFLGLATIVSISGIFYLYVDILMLGTFVPLEYVGHYKVASSIILGAKSLFAYLSSVLLPVFIVLERKRLELAFNKVMRFILAFLIPASFGLLALGKYIIKFLYGSSYLPSIYPLVFLSLALITFTPVAVIVALFFSKEKPGQVAKALTLALLLNIILNYILITSLLKVSETWAMSGAAISTLISRYFLLFYIVIILNKKLKIKTKKINFFKPIVASLVMFLVLYILNTFIFKNMNLIVGMGEICLAIIIYFSIMFLIKGIVKEDISLFKKLPYLRKLKWLKKNDINQTN